MSRICAFERSSVTTRCLSAEMEKLQNSTVQTRNGVAAAVSIEMKVHAPNPEAEGQRPMIDDLPKQL